MRLIRGLCVVVVLVGLGVAGVTSAAGIQRLHPAGVHWMGTDDIAFSPNGRWLVGAGWENQPRGTHGVYVRSVNEGTGALGAVRSKPFLTAFPRPTQLALSPNGRLLLAMSWRGIAALSMNPSTGWLSRIASYPVRFPTTVAFSPRGGLVAVPNENTLLMLAVNSRTGRLRYAARWSPGKYVGIGDGTDVPIAFSPHGKLLAVITGFGVTVLSVGRHGNLRVWGGVSGNLSGYPSVVAFSPNGRFLAISGSGASGNGILMLRVDWRARRLRRVPGRVFQDGLQDQMVFSPDGKLLVLDNADQEQEWYGVVSVNEHTGRLRQLSGSPVWAGPGRVANSVAFSPTGHLLALGTMTWRSPYHEAITMLEVRR